MSSTRRSLWGWDAAVVATCLAAATIILVLGEGSHRGGFAAGGPFLILVVYVAIGRRALVASKGTSITRWATVLLMAAGVVSAYFAPFAALSQAVLFPLMWVLSSGLRAAIIRSGVLALGMGLSTGLGNGDWVSASVGAVLAFAFTLGLGLWITRIQEYGVERDRLLTELRAAQEEVAALERQAGITEERARVAREIHDTIAQSLTGLVMTAQRARSVAERTPDSLGPTLALMENLATEALSEARALVAAYTPVSVSGGLTVTLSALAERFSMETGVAVTVTGQALDVDREAEVVLLRCAQEALANVRKHAHAGKVSIALAAGEEGAEVTVTDDGVGIGEQAGRGYGLAGMAERVRLAGGSLGVSSVEGGGTAVQVVLPRRTADEVRRTPDEVVS